MEMVLHTIGAVFSYIIHHLVIINMIFSVVVIFFQRKEPKSVWAWLLLLYFIPILGFIIYLLAGTDMHKRKMFKVKEIEDQLNATVRRQEDSIQTRQLERINPELKRYEDLIYYNLDSSNAVLTEDNAVTVYTDGNDKFERLLQDIKAAEEFIHLQYYIIREGPPFDAIVEALKEKAAAGVEVLILFDSMGCRSMKKKDWQELREAGIRTTEFFPALLGRLQLRMNYRNHRKIAIIDGKIGYVGGFNIGKEYLGMDPKFGYWRDTHLRIEGSAVFNLQMRFILDWNYAAKENLFIQPKYYVLLDDIKGNVCMQIVSSGPDSSLQNIRNNYLRLIGKARKSIYIQTPYFIPDEAIMSALVVAAHAGIQVNIMIPCKPDHPFVYWATYSYIGDMVMAGANCYTYDDGFLHAKGMIVDDEVYCYGTANMDIRSFSLNFEVNAVVYDRIEAQKMVAVFREDLKKSTQITKDLYASRSLLIRLKEQVCRLLSPLL